MLQQLLFLAQICGCERYLPQNQAVLKAVLKEINVDLVLYS